MPDPRVRQQFMFILEVEKLKQVLRRTPLLDGSRRENDAEHSWEIALMAMMLHEHADEDLDLLHNFFTSGGTWHTPGVTSRDVLERKVPIANASDTLWQAAQRIIAEGVGRGFLKEG